jgi:hypothetical protein
MSTEHAPNAPTPTTTARREERAKISSAGARGDRLRKVVLRVHGTLLLAVTTVSTIIITIGYNTGTGIYGMLPDQPLGFGGLYQAYTLMFVIGVALWIGSTQPRPRLFNVVGMLAHIPLVIGNLFFADVFAQVADGRVGLISLPIHAGLAGLELFAIVWKPRPAVPAAAMESAVPS